MAQLKDSLITGDLRVTGTIYGNVPLNDLVDADDLKAIEALSGTSGILKKTAANTWTLDTNSYTTTSGTVTSVQVQATSPVVSSVNTAQSATLNTTISLANGYGDTKNPYASKTARYVLAAPASADGAPIFRALTNADVGLGNVENTKLSTWAGSGNITTIGTLAAGTVPWARLSDVPSSMTPSSHAHGNITNEGKIGTAANQAAYTTTNGVVTAGTLPAAAGGTGKTTLKDAANALINALDTGSSNLTENDYVITQYVGGGTTTTTYHRRPASAIRVGGLLTGKKLKVKLNSTTDVTFDGTADQTAIPVSGTLSVANGGTGATSLANITVGKATADADGNTISSTYVKKAGDNMTGRLTMTDGKAINQILTGTGTAGADNGSGANPRYIPAKWTFNTALTATDGDIFTIKIPVIGHSYGVYMSINNGVNYYPVVLNGTGRITNHYAVNTYLQVIFESTGSAASMTPLAGANSANGSTITGGVFRVINYYDSGNNYNWVRPYYIYWKAKTVLYRYMMLFTYDEQYLLPVNTTDNSTATNKTLTTDSFDPYGDIYYYGNTGTISAGSRISDNSIYSMTGLIDLRYSFNTGTTLTAQKAVYLVMAPQSNGKVKLHTTPIAQTLPTTDDGLLYKYIGQAYDTYRIQMIQEKPIYIFKNGAIRSYSGYADAVDWDNIYNTPTTLTGYGITDAATSDHVHGNITNDGKIGTTTDYAVYTTTDGLLTAGTLKTDDPTTSGTGITYIATVSQDSKGKITATKSTVRDASTSQSGVVSTGAQSFAGAKTFTDKITIGTTSQTAAPTASITIHDTRNYTWTPTSLDKGVNWYFTQSNSPDTGKWWSIMHLTGWTGDYNAWELAGPSHNIDQRTTPLYVRSGRTTNGWGSWRKIYDTSNKPSVSNHTYTPAGTIAKAINGEGATTTVSEITEWIPNTPTAVTPNNVVTSTGATAVSVTDEVLTIPASVLTSSVIGASASVTAGTSASLTYNGETVKSGDASYVFTGTEATLTHTVS